MSLEGVTLLSGWPPSSPPQPLSQGIPWFRLSFLARTQVSAPPHPSRLSSSLPHVLDPGPSPHPPCAPLQLGLPGGLTHLLWALAFLCRCCAHLAKSCWHPPSASAHPPSPRLSPVPEARPALQGSPDPHCHLLKDSSSLSSSFPPSLLPSTLAFILHSGSLLSAYKRVFFPPPCPVLWFEGLAVVIVPGVPLWFSLTRVPRSGPCPHPSTLSRSSLPFTWPDPTASRH